jgi:c-di-GMP-binding flagellar brake protein YcgR
MENRRQDYRHPFAPGARLTAEVTPFGASAAVPGQTVDLSVGGVALLFASPVPGLAAQAPHHVSLQLGPGNGLAVRAVVAHKRACEDGHLYGLSFLPLGSDHANEERQRGVWLFLLEEQRRQRQRLHDAGRQVP